MNGVLQTFRNRLALLARGDEGVVLALSLAFMLPLFVLTVCIYALQETLVRKAELQNAVDAAAYSAAVAQSDYFSRFALVNKILGWTYVQRERARADYAMVQLCREANAGLVRDRDDCRRNNARSCCAKHMVEDVDWGVGTLTGSSAESGAKIKFYSPREIVNIIRNGVTENGNPLNQDTKPYYSYGNNVADNKTLLIASVRAAASETWASQIDSKIREYGRIMTKCRTAFDRLETEFPTAVRHAAEDILRLNLNQTETDWYSHVTVPEIGNLVAPFKCSETDEKRLFEAAGLSEAKRTPQAALGLGADKFFVLGSKWKNLPNHDKGPSWLGRQVQNGWDVGSMTGLQAVGMMGGLFTLIYIWCHVPIVGWITAAAIAGFMIESAVTDSRQQKIDALFGDIRDDRTGYQSQCSCKDSPNCCDGPCRVLYFARDKYLLMEWQFFWKRYVRLGVKGVHFCIPPAKFLGKRVGQHKWGAGRASIYGRRYGSNEDRQTALPGNPVIGKAIGAKGRKLKQEFFGPEGSIRIIAARDNPNPLRIFGGEDGLKGLLKKIPGGKIAPLVKRYDAGGIYQIFNAHLSDNQSLQFDKFEGSQCPNFLYAVAASRIATRTDSTVEYKLSRPALMTVTDGCCSLCSTDWEPFLVPFRAANYTGWNTPGATLAHPSDSILGRLKDAVSFEAEMRLGKEWTCHQRKGTKWSESDLRGTGVGNLNILTRMNDTRGPYPTDIEHGSSLLSWGLANEYINH